MYTAEAGANCVFPSQLTTLTYEGVEYDWFSSNGAQTAVVKVLGAGTQLTLTENLAVSNVGGRRHTVFVNEGGTLIAEKNLYVDTSNGSSAYPDTQSDNSRALMIGAGSRVEVRGSLFGFKKSLGRTTVVEIEPNAHLTVNQNVYIETEQNPDQALRSHGTTLIEGNFTLKDLNTAPRPQPTSHFTSMTQKGSISVLGRTEITSQGNGIELNGPTSSLNFKSVSGLQDIVAGKAILRIGDATINARFNAIQATDTSTNVDLLLEDGSDLTGDILLAAGSDIFVMQDGARLAGDVYLGLGDDTARFENGAILQGIVEMGDGADALTLVDGFNISGNLFNTADVASLDGGAGSDSLIFENMSFEAFGSNFLNWESIFLQNGSNITLSDAADTFSASLAEGEGIFLRGGSKLTLLGNHVIDANLTMDAGTNLLIRPGNSMLRTVGGNALETHFGGNMMGGGTVDMITNNSGDHFSIGGNYTANGGLWLLEANLTGDETISISDHIHIAGDALAMKDDQISITNLYAPAPTGEESVLVVEVTGNSEANFVLKDRVVAGAYEYFLHKNTDGSWYLKSLYEEPEEPTPTEETNPALSPDVGSYSSLALGATSLFDHSWRDRFGAVRGAEEHGRSSWARITGRDADRDSEGDKISSDYTQFSALVGMDVAKQTLNGQDDLIMGVMLGYANQSSRSWNTVSGSTSSSSIEGTGIGAYASWLENGLDGKGFYLDAAYTYGDFDADLAPANESFGLASHRLSFELGYSADLEPSATARRWIEPKLQLTWSKLEKGSITQASGANVDFSGEALDLRLGLRAAAQSFDDQITSFVQVDWTSALNSPDVQIANYTVDTDAGESLRLSGGFSNTVNERLTIDGEVGYKHDFKGGNGYDAALLMNYKF